MGWLRSHSRRRSYSRKRIPLEVEKERKRIPPEKENTSLVREYLLEVEKENTSRGILLPEKENTSREKEYLSR